jgi:hypothetical protein
MFNMVQTTNQQPPLQDLQSLHPTLYRSLRTLSAWIEAMSTALKSGKTSHGAGWFGKIYGWIMSKLCFFARNCRVNNGFETLFPFWKWSWFPSLLWWIRMNDRGFAIFCWGSIELCRCEQFWDLPWSASQVPKTQRWSSNMMGTNRLLNVCSAFNIG